MRQYLHQGINVETMQCACRCQRVFGMADVEIVVLEPDVGFDAYAPCGKRIVQGYLAPVVVVRVAWYGNDVAAREVWVKGNVRGLGGWIRPG